MNNKKKKKIFQSNCIIVASTRSMSTCWMNFHLSLPVFLFRDYHDLRGKIAPVLFSLNYSPDGIGIFSSFLPATKWKNGGKRFGPSVARRFHSFLLALQKWERRHSSKEITRRALILRPIVISCRFYLSPRSNSKPRQSLAIACLIIDSTYLFTDIVFVILQNFLQKERSRKHFDKSIERNRD